VLGAGDPDGGLALWSPTLRKPRRVGQPSVGQISNHLHRRFLVPVSVRFHDNLHVVIERDQKAQQAFDGELAELAAQHLRHIGLADAE
jgi:hypothetical protein